MLRIPYDSIPARAARALLRHGQAALLKHIPGSSLSWGPPRRWRASAGDLGSRTGTYVEIYPPSVFRRATAHSVSQNPPAVFQKAIVEPVGAHGVHLLVDGRVIGGDVVVVTADDEVVLDLSMQFAPYYASLYRDWRLPPVRHIAGPVLVLAGPPGYNYGHWIHQMLPRLHLAMAAGFSIGDFAAIVVNRGPRFIRDSLTLAGIPADRCIEVDPLLHVCGSPLVVPTIPSGGNPPPWVPAFHRQTFWPAEFDRDANRQERIYVSRAKASSRRILNEPELISLLARRGFRSVCLEDLSFQQQVELFRHAEVVCGAHGSGLTNVFFCQPGAKLVEIIHPSFPEICWWSMSSVSDVDYYFVCGDGPVQDFATDWRHNYVDFNCGAEVLERTLDLADAN